MITFLCVITVVVSLIIITMANLFNNDKTTYIRDLAAVIALHVAEEANSLLQGYHQKLRVFTEAAYNTKLSSDRKREIVVSLFRNFDDFVAVSVQEGDAEPVMVYDGKALEGAGLEEKDLAKYLKDHPLSPDRINSVPVYVENATITARLPLLLVATADVLPNDGTPVVITAMVRLDALLSLASRPSAFQAFIVDSEGVLIAHSDVDRVVQRASADWIPNLENLVAQNQLLGTTIEYEHEGKEMIGGFAGIKSSGLLAGVQIPKAVAYLTARTLLNNLVLLSLALLIATAVLSVFLAHRLTRPLEKLTHAVRQVGKGHFDIFVESLSAFGQLSAGIAHEVKNPLAGILGHAQLCLRKLSEDDPMHNHLNIIQHETKRCTEIISNLMKFARQEKMEYEPTDLNDVIKHGMAIVDHQLSLNQVKIQMNLADNLPEINGNANQLQQVLMNFAINAQQALDGKPGVVRLTTDKTDDGDVLLVFADNGPGIPKNIRDKIFEPFFTTKPAGKGTGLGLSVTYGIIKDHNGEITIESELGTGTAFVMKFPGIVDDIVVASSAA
jgi:signal transduction histidine kinase